MRSQPPRPAPVAPRLAAEPQSVRPRDLASFDEWIDQRVDGADLSGCAADEVEISACELRGVVLTGADLERLRLADVVATDCELSGTLARESSMVRVEFRSCRMSGLMIAESKLSNVRFVDCKLDDANLRFVQGEQVVFDRCSLVDADFYSSTLTNSAFDSCDLARAQFSKASVDGVRLVGSKLEGLRGAIAMAGVVIGGDQVLPLALSAFSDLGIVIEYDEPEEPVRT